jgi:cysteine-rich repeat protein
MTPGQTVYAHVLEYNDDAAVTAYGLEIRFLVCGDGIVASPAEACDDGNSVNGDGCSSTCTIEAGYQCSGQPSMCRPPENQCNDGMDNDLDGQSDCADSDCAAGCTSYFPACTAGQSLRVFNSGNVNLPIPDGSTTGVTSNIDVTATGTVRRVAIKFNIIHDFDADLDLSFRGPTGPFLDASSDNGSTGFDYLNTVLDSTCATPVTSGVAPFSACYSPEATFSGFNNASMTGTWSFKAADDFSIDTGTLSNWSLIMCTQ